MCEHAGTTQQNDSGLKLVLVSLGVLCVHLALMASLQVNLCPEPMQTAQTPVQTRQILERQSTPPGATQVAHPSPLQHVIPFAQNKEIEARANQLSTSTVNAQQDASTSATFKLSPSEDIDPLTKTDPSEHASNPSAKTGGVGKNAASGEIRLPSNQADYLNNPPPNYPALSRRLHEIGKVVVRVLIGGNGQALQGGIAQSSGFERLDQSALKAALNWRYVPGKVDGQVQDMWFDVPITFKLSN